MKSERGAASVEFALLVPILIMLVFGVMEFSRAYNVQVSLTNAAREGVRSVALNKSQDTPENQEKARKAARDAATAAAAHLTPALKDSDITFSPASCTAGSQIKVDINYNLTTMTGIAGPFALLGTGTMLCGG